MKTTKTSALRAFTLIELLVVPVAVGRGVMRSMVTFTPRALMEVIRTCSK